MTALDAPGSRNDRGAVPPLSELEGWPGADRREPNAAHPARLTLRPLAQMISAAIATRVAPAGSDQAVLDVGCGVKPYLPFFAPIAREYVGVDIAPGARVDVVAPAEALPFPDGRFDAVVCTQVLEHVQDPPAVIREIERVLKPAGVALISTHGTAVYHPGPSDLWRWTQEGLPKLIRDNGEWSSVELEAAGGTAACFGYLLGFYVDAALRVRPLHPVRDVLLTLINLVFGALDRIVPLRPPREFTLISNFLAVARKST